MTLYVGEALRITSKALDPVTEEPLNPQPDSGAVDFWAPGKNPRTDETVRDAPDVANVALVHDTATNEWTATVSTNTAVWAPGRWSYRITFTGVGGQNWEYGTLRLRA